MTSLASPAAVCLTVNRSTAAPASSITQTACSDHDQSTPAHLIGPSAVPAKLSVPVMAGSTSFVCGWFIAVVAPV